MKNSTEVEKLRNLKWKELLSRTQLDCESKDSINRLTSATEKLSSVISDEELDRQNSPFGHA